MKKFSEWFHNILEEAELIDSRYPIKGMSVWLPRGFQIRKYALKALQELLDKDHEEVLFPMLIPESELAKEAIHVKGFEDEVYWVTKGGKRDLNEQLALRPTSETSMMWPIRGRSICSSSAACSARLSPIICGWRFTAVQRALSLEALRGRRW